METIDIEKINYDEIIDLIIEKEFSNLKQFDKECFRELINSMIGNAKLFYHMGRCLGMRELNEKIEESKNV